MNLLASAPSAPPPESFRRWGDGLLWGALGLGLIGTFALAWVQPDLLPLVPLVLLGGLALSVLVRYPLLHLCVVLLSLTFVLDLSEGIRVSEVVVTLYYLSYLGGWFCYHVFLRREPILRDTVDYVVAIYLAFSIASLGLTVLYGGNPFVALNEWRRFFVLAFYFPLKEICLRDPRAFRALLVTFVIVALILVARNLFRYYAALQSAEALWEIMTNRARNNERFIMMGFLGSLVFLFHMRSGWVRIALAVASVALLSGTIAGQSRALWVATALGLFVALLALEGRQRLRLVFLLSGGAATLAIATLVLFNDAFSLILVGLFDRFATLETAASKDLSLINRFYEWRSALDRIVESPLFGHGFGVAYPHFNLISKVTEAKTFVHNSYVGILYRHGLIGLSCVGFIVLVSFGRAVALLRDRSLLPNRISLAYPIALAGVTIFPAMALAAMAEDVLLTIGGAFTLAFPAALLTGLWLRRRTEAPPVAKTSSPGRPACRS